MVKTSKHCWVIYVPIPPEPILRAAARWLALMPSSGEERTRALLAASERYRDLSPTQYETGIRWLKAAGLFAEATQPSTSRLPPEVRVFRAAVESAEWFEDADLLVRDQAELPLDAIGAADALRLTSEEAFLHLRSEWAKVDTSRREEVGRAGEAELAALLQRSTEPYVDVDHVALRTDALGYDIAVRHPGGELHLEVKSSTRTGRSTFYLSRNEYGVSLVDAAWVLVLVHLDSDLRLSRIDTVVTSWIEKAAPRDEEPHARWESAKFDPRGRDIIPGLPAVVSHLADPISPLILP